jgi:hypothetical protein
MKQLCIILNKENTFVTSLTEYFRINFKRAIKVKLKGEQNEKQQNVSFLRYPYL